MSSLADRYRRWFEYEKDSHAKVLTTIRAAAPEAQTSPAFAKAVTLLGHILTARRVWLFRLGAAAECPRPEEFFPAGLSVSELSARAEATHAAWDRYLSRLDDAELARTFRYKSFDAGWFQDTVEDILTQMFGHSWYHRGQIASLLKSAGIDPPATDFVYWAREPVPPPSV